MMGTKDEKTIKEIEK